MRPYKLAKDYEPRLAPPTAPRVLTANKSPTEHDSSCFEDEVAILEGCEALIAIPFKVVIAVG
jgi:hypothetical protein